MTKHLISYDLSKPHRDYTSLIKAIKSLGTRWSHPLESVWIVDNGLTAEQIRDRLAAHLDGDDKLFVAGMTGEWAATRLKARIVEWLKKRPVAA